MFVLPTSTVSSKRVSFPRAATRRAGWASAVSATGKIAVSSSGRVTVPLSSPEPSGAWPGSVCRWTIRLSASTNTTRGSYVAASASSI